jgi:Domain of unknown function (DUF4340)
MPVRGLLVAVVILGILAGGVYWSERNKAAEDAKEASGGPSKLVNVKQEDVRKVEIRRRDAPAVVLERDKANNWQMLAPETWRVDQDETGGLASSYSGLSYDRVVEERATDLAGYGLQPPSLEVIFTAKDGKTRKLMIGDETPTGSAVFAKFEDDPRVFTLPSSTKTSLDKAAKDLRDKRLLTFDPEKLSRVELVAKGGPIEFGRNAKKEWQIVKPKPQRADNGHVEELVRKLKDARMDTSVSDEVAAKAASSFAGGSRVASANLTDSAGTHTIEVRKKGDDYFARSSGLQGIFKIPSDVGEGLNKALDDFRNKKLFDFAFDDPTSVTVRDGDKQYAIQKSGEKWLQGGKQMDAISVQSLIDKLRDLSAIKFVDNGFTTPIMELSVTSDGGKRVEKVQIAKNGNSYFARREGEPAIYEVDSKNVEEIQRAAADVKEPPPPPKK